MIVMEKLGRFFHAFACAVLPLVIISPSIPIVFMGFIDVVYRNTVFMPTLSTFPHVVMIIEAVLVIQISTTTVTPPISIWKSITHLFHLLLSIFFIFIFFIIIRCIIVLDALYNLSLSDFYCIR